MIITTYSNTKVTFSIAGDDFYFNGKVGALSPTQKITLSNNNDTITGIYKMSNLLHYIPFWYLFGKEKLIRKFNIYKNDVLYGNVLYSAHGFLRGCYIITLNNGKIIKCYCRSKGSFNYVSIYMGKKQIALLETCLNVDDYLYKYKLYLLEEYNALFEILSFFTLYYANYTFLKRFHFGSTSTYEKSYSFSSYNDKYSNDWREKNFPEENFYGKTNMTD